MNRYDIALGKLPEPEYKGPAHNPYSASFTTRYDDADLDYRRTFDAVTVTVTSPATSMRIALPRFATEEQTRRATHDACDRVMSEQRSKMRIEMESNGHVFNYDQHYIMAHAPDMVTTTSPINTTNSLRKGNWHSL
jgi:hypothetical protein